MPNFLRIKDPATGLHTLVQVNPDEVKPITVTEPPSATLQAPQVTKRFKCLVCDKPFAGVGVMSMHFIKSHKDLATTKETWRQYLGVVDGADSKGSH